MLSPASPEVQQLPEHLHPGHHLLRRRPEPDDLHFLPDLHPPAVHPARHHRAAPRDREHVLNRHQERPVHLARRQRHILVERVHQLQDARHALRIPVQRPERAHAHHRHRIPREPIRRQQLPHLQLHQVQQLRVVDRVHLVQRHHQARHVHLPRQQHVLPRLRHRPVHRAHHQDAAVHLRGPRDHVLDVVRMPRAVHVRVVPVRRAVLHVARRNRQDLRRIPTPLRLRRLRHLVIRDELRPALFRRHLRQRRRQRRLPVVDVPNRPHVHMRFRPIELFLRHFDSSRFAYLRQSLRSRRAVAASTRAPAPARRLPRSRSAAPARSDRSACCRWRGPASATAGRSSSRTSPTAARAH